MSATEHALLAVLAREAGQAATAEQHIATAKRETRAKARRDRQLVEIAALVVRGDGVRAAGLALEHTVEFPDDAILLSQLTGRERAG
jgi:hypothetical protein